MTFGLSEEQEMLKTAARDFLTNECPRTHVREMMDDEVGYSPELWKKMADLIVHHLSYVCPGTFICQKISSCVLKHFLLFTKAKSHI